MAPFRILSLDGGGIRGLIPALMLSELKQRTGKRTAQLFDLIAGTSTGGILALGLTRPGAEGQPLFTADEMVGLYEKDGGKIFDRGMLHRFKALGNLADEKYPSHGIDAVLKARFGETMLSEAVTRSYANSAAGRPPRRCSSAIRGRTRTGSGRPSRSTARSVPGSISEHETPRIP